MNDTLRLAALALALSLASPGSGLARQPRPSPPQRVDARPAAEPVSAAPDTDTPKFPGDVELVTVDVVVTDKSGRSLSGLTAADFTVEEEGVPQLVSSFEAVELPPAPAAAPPVRPRVSTNQVPHPTASRTFLIVFDDLHLSPTDAPQAKGAVASFLNKGVREGDYVSLLATSGDAWWNTRLEAGREDLLAVLRRLEGRRLPESRLDRLSDWEAMRIAQFHDTIVGDRVLRRFQTLRLTPDDAFPSSRVDGVRASREEDSLLYQRGINDLMVESRASEIYNNVKIRSQRTLATLERALDSLSSAKGRKSLVLVSDGFILDTGLDGFKRVAQAARRSNVAIYFVNTRGLRGLEGLFGADMVEPIVGRDTGAVMADLTQEAAGSEHLSDDTGGFVIRNTNDLGGGIERIAKESLSYYLLGFNPVNTPRDGSYRRLAVKVRGRKDVVIRARRGYYAPLDGGAERGTARKADADLQRALDSPFFDAGIPARMTAFVREEALPGQARTLLAAEIDVTELAFRTRADGRRVGTLNLLFTVSHRESSEAQREDKVVEIVLRPGPAETTERVWYAVSREFQLGAGWHQAKLVIRDGESRRVGTVTHDFEVPRLGGWRVSTPALTDTLQQPQGTGSPAAPMLIARREFASGGSLFCQFDVYGAEKGKVTGQPQVTAGYALVSADGRTVLEGAPTAIRPTSLGFVSRLWAIGLAGLVPGGYELVITVADEVAGRRQELREPFTVTGAPQRAVRR